MINLAKELKIHRMQIGGAGTKTACGIMLNKVAHYKNTLRGVTCLRCKEGAKKK